MIFFRNQHSTEARHIPFAHRFEKININPFFRAVDGYPHIAEVRKELEQKANIGGGWHTYHSYHEALALGSVLYARTCPRSAATHCSCIWTQCLTPCHRP